MSKYTNEQIELYKQHEKVVIDNYMSSPEYVEKLKNRLQIQDACERSVIARAHTWKLCQRESNLAEGAIFFIENFLWVDNPKGDVKNLPFFLFDFQKRAVYDIIDSIENGKDLLLEKSREMGASWLLFSAVSLWYWFFKEGSNILLGSYKQDLVDNRTIDSLFGKIDYQIATIPKWLIPKGFVLNKHRTSMKLYNPENGNLITGDSMNPNFSRGSRKTAVFFDELAFWDYAQDAWDSSADVTNCRIAVSTPQGYNFFAMLRESGIRILRLHWKEHPLKDLEWYNYQSSRRSEEQVAQELDINYSKSKIGRVYSEWVEPTVQFGLYDYDYNLPLYIAWDFGKSDDNAMIWCQPSSNGLRIIDVYRNNGKNIDFYIPFVNGFITGDNRYEYSKSELEIIKKHNEWNHATHFGDPAGRFTNQTSDESVIDILRRYGININFREEWKYFNVRKSAAKRLIMDGILLNDNDRVRYFDMCMIQASYPERKQNGLGVVNSEKPKHDYTSHYRSAFEYLALGLEGIVNKNSNRKVFDKFKRVENRSNSIKGWGRNRIIKY